MSGVVQHARSLEISVEHPIADERGARVPWCVHVVARPGAPLMIRCAHRQHREHLVGEDLCHRLDAEDVIAILTAACEVLAQLRIAA